MRRAVVALGEFVSGASWGRTVSVAVVLVAVGTYLSYRVLGGRVQDARDVQRMA